MELNTIEIETVMLVIFFLYNPQEQTYAYILKYI